MIVIDTSALLAILQEEPGTATCLAALQNADEVLISAGTMTEALIVSSRRNLHEALSTLISRLQIQVVSLTHDGARRAAEAHLRWGKGIHPAGLNFGDCFAYALARERKCPLLFVGEDFSQTDIVPAA